MTARARWFPPPSSPACWKRLRRRRARPGTGVTDAHVARGGRAGRRNAGPHGPVAGADPQGFRFDAILAATAPIRAKRG